MEHIKHGPGEEIFVRHGAGRKDDVEERAQGHARELLVDREHEAAVRVRERRLARVGDLGAGDGEAGAVAGLEAGGVVDDERS